MSEPTPAPLPPAPAIAPPAPSAASVSEPAFIPLGEIVKMEYEYARGEIVARLGFDRSILQLQVAILVAVIGGIFSEHFSKTDNYVLLVIAFGGMVLNAILMLEIRSNRIHRLRFGKFLRDGLYSHFPSEYLRATDGGLVGYLRGRIDCVPGYHPHCMNSYMIACGANLVLCSGVMLKTLSSLERVLTLKTFAASSIALGVFLFTIHQIYLFTCSDNKVPPIPLSEHRPDIPAGTFITLYRTYRKRR